MPYQNFPRRVSLESSARCNARCVFCPLFHGEEPMNAPVAFMNAVLFEKCAKEIAGWDSIPDVIAVHGRGEPLTDPDFLEKIQVLRALGLSERIVLITNAHLLTEAVATALCKANIRTIRPAMDSSDKQIYESIRVGCSFETVRDNIIRFAKIRTLTGAKTRIQIQHICTPDSLVDDAEKLYDLFKPHMDRTDEMAVIPSMPWATSHLKDKKCILNKPSAQRTVMECPRLGRELSVFTDGSVPACCQDYNFHVDGLMGNANDETLLDIWRSEKFMRLRADIGSGNDDRLPAYCKNCISLFQPEYMPLKQPSPRIPQRPTDCGFMFTFA